MSDRVTGKAKPDALLARMLAAHPERADMDPPVVVRVAGADGVLRFAAVIDTIDDRRKVKEFATGRERWVERTEIVEAC